MIIGLPRRWVSQCLNCLHRTAWLFSRGANKVLDLVSQGLTNKEIGRTLYITESTVKVHVRKICTKFGVRSRTEAAMRAAEMSD